MGKKNAFITMKSPVALDLRLINNEIATTTTTNPTKTNKQKPMCQDIQQTFLKKMVRLLLARKMRKN